jgi:hypothetical protein
VLDADWWVKHRAETYPGCLNGTFATAFDPYEIL